MNTKILKACLTALALCMMTGCLTKGEFARVGTTAKSPKPEGFNVPILTPPIERAYEVIALVTSRETKLEKAVAELNKQARLAGADALIEFKQERKFSGDTWTDLYFLEAKAIAYR
jgi:hypothetical protein